MKSKTEKAVFAAGCFWGVEHAFRQVRGVVDVRSGYTGGHTKNPTYDDVCSDQTGHAEAVEVVFDPKKVTFKQLLKVFWHGHDPTQFNRQGPDVGSQYRSAIFYQDEKQKKEAFTSLATAQKKHEKKIMTEIVKATVFYPAEEYHQRYYEKHKVAACAFRLIKKL